MWDYFDCIYCINLISRNDKYEQMKSLFNKHNIPVNFLRVNRDNENPTRGCFNSHFSIIKIAYEKNYKNVLILEDDINFNFLTEQKLKRCIDFMSNNYYEIFFLGSFPDIMNFSVKNTYEKGIYKMNSICGHGYVLNRTYIQKVFDMNYIDVPLDYLYKFNKHSYGILPPLIIQTAQNSDINDDLINRNSYLKWCTSRYVCLYAKYINVPIKNVYFYVFLISLLYIILNFKEYIPYMFLLFIICLIYSKIDYNKYNKLNKL